MAARLFTNGGECLQRTHFATSRCVVYEKRLLFRKKSISQLVIAWFTNDAFCNQRSRALQKTHFVTSHRVRYKWQRDCLRMTASVYKKRIL